MRASSRTAACSPPSRTPRCPRRFLRGKLVREQILCDEIPPPPPNVPAPPTTVPDGGTTRSQFEAHATSAFCAGCHQFMDPIGYGFGHFDATGAYQTLDANGFDDGSGYRRDGSGHAHASRDVRRVLQRRAGPRDEARRCAPGAAVLRAAGAALRARPHRDHGRRVLGAAGLRVVRVESAQHPEAPHRHRPERRVPVPVGPEPGSACQ